MVEDIVMGVYAILAGGFLILVILGKIGNHGWEHRK